MDFKKNMDNFNESLQSLKVAKINSIFLWNYIILPILAFVLILVSWFCLKKLFRCLLRCFKKVTGSDVESQLFPEVHIQIKQD